MSGKLTPQAFVAKWKPVTGKEISVAQSHFNDICALIDYPTPVEEDPTATHYCFEAGVVKATGGLGRADVWKKGYFAWEYKGKHGDLAKAYDQLLRYKDSLQNPPLLIVCDIAEIRIHTNFTNSVKKVECITLDDLLKPEKVSLLRRAFTDPASFRAPQTAEQVTNKAAAEFARLAQLFVKWGHDPQAVAHFLIRILFCFFAEDVELLPANIFSRLLLQAKGKPKLFRPQLTQLFGAMITGGCFGVDEIRHFDGGLFDDAGVLDADGDALDIMARASALDWANIQPSIFGTLFERSLDPSKRAQLGAHYTGEEDILLIVEPVLMAPWRRRWAEIQAQAHELAAARDAASGARRTRLHNALVALLRDFRHELASIRVLDAACGSGNFLYVALRLLLSLEKEVIGLATALGDSAAFPSVSPEQVYGIEINPYAHELAQVTVWIGYIQWMRENGFGAADEPILKPLHNIIQMDAILAYDAEGKPVEPEWQEAFAIIGNPPFLGGKRLRTELGDAYVDDLFSLYQSRVPREADLVCYWFERARQQIALGRAKRVGLLATQGIRGGANRKVLERIKQTGDVFMAWSDRPWVLEGAAVRVSIVGFDDGREDQRTLNGISTAAINANLTTELDLPSAQRLPENLGIAYMGDTKGGAFDISADVATAMLNAPANPNGHRNAEVVRSWANGLDITRRPRNMWIIDFGTNTSIDEAALFELPFEYVARTVRPERANNNRATYKERWWIHAEPRPAMRAAIAPLQRYIVSPSLAKHRLFVWLTGETLPDHQLFVFCRQDDYFFGVLHSKIHQLWALRLGTALEDRPRYTPTTTFETFPFPWPPAKEPTTDSRVEAIAAAARDLVAKRESWLNPAGADEGELKKRTLTNLYNQRPTWLELAHKRLDDAVFDAYGWPHDFTDDEILARLLALNLERAGKP